jgi:hypothetical protein
MTGGRRLGGPLAGTHTGIRAWGEAVRYVIGVVVIFAGIAQIAFRARTARASAASNSVMFNGHLSGRGWIRYNTTMAAFVGGIFVVFGILMIAGVFGPVR